MKISLRSEVNESDEESPTPLPDIPEKGVFSAARSSVLPKDKQVLAQGLNEKRPDHLLTNFGHSDNLF